MKHDPLPEPISKAVEQAHQVDGAQRQEYLEAAAREIAGRHHPNRGWVWAGIPIVIFGVFLIVATWSWKGGSMGRYGFHPTFVSCLVVFLGGLMIRRGRHGV